MKRIIMIISLVLSAVLAANAQAPETQAYPNGIYVFCRKEMPGNFYYLIEKQDASGVWKEAVELRAPQNAAALKANLLRLPDFFAGSMPLPTDRVEMFWERINLSKETDSLFYYSADPKIMAALGCGWFDDGLKTSGEYRYRISKIYRTGTIPLGEVSRKFPENSYTGKLKTVCFTPEGTSVTLYYGFDETLSTSDIILFRSRMMENNYKQVAAKSAFTIVDGQTLAVIHDESVARGMAYSYVAVPRDALGNLGKPSDTVQVYNLVNFNEIGIAKSFKAVADKAKKGITLSWDMSSDFYIHSYEIFRSREYETGYQSVATLPGDVTSYFDYYGLEYGVAYFYYMVVNNGYGDNVRTVSTPVILEGAAMNFMPPQNVEAELRGNVVHLSFSSIDDDTWGYQIFRGEGYMGELSPIASLSVEHKLTPEGESPVVVFTDTLALSHKPQTISYAVADVNSSYNLSPLSERVTVQYNGGMMPAPSNVQALFRDDLVFVMWDDMSKIHSYIGSYAVWRSVLINDKESEAQLVAMLSYEQNYYLDSLVTPGTRYRYMVESIGLDGESSGKSLHAGVTVPQQLPLPPGQVSTLATEKSMLLRWDNPLDPNIRNIRIYRATENAPATQIKELPADESNFEDLTAQKSVQYYYFVVTVNTRGEESKREDPVGGKIR